MKEFKILPKVLTLLILLLLSSNIFSFPIPADSDTEDKVILSAELEQADHELSDFDISSAPVPEVFQKNFCDAVLFRLASQRLEINDRIYLKFSAEITPALDTSRLIYPFHFFF